MDWGQTLVAFVVQLLLGLGLVFALYGLFRLRFYLQGSDYRQWSWAFQFIGIPLALCMSFSLQKAVVAWLY